MPTPKWGAMAGGVAGSRRPGSGRVRTRSLLHSRAVTSRFRFARSLVFTLTGTLLGCRPPASTELPICKSEVVGAEAQEVASGQIPSPVWFLLLLSNYNRETSLVTRPVKDCSGRPVQTTVADEQIARCLAPPGRVTELPPRALTDEDLLIAPSPDGRQLAWVQTHHYDDGEASGPIAVVEWSAQGVIVRAIGTLRAYANKAAMRLEPMGAGKVLVVESRVCDPDDPRRCERVTRLLPLVGDTFVETPLVAEDGACLGPAQFSMHREQTVKLENGLLRKFEMATSIDFTSGQALVTEQVKIEDSDPAQPQAPAKVFREANIQRPLQLVANGVVTKPGLWERMLNEFGSVRIDGE